MAQKERKREINIGNKINKDSNHLAEKWHRKKERKREINIGNKCIYLGQYKTTIL